MDFYIFFLGIFPMYRFYKNRNAAQFKSSPYPDRLAEELRISSMVRFMEKLPHLICQFGVPCASVDSW